MPRNATKIVILTIIFSGILFTAHSYVRAQCEDGSEPVFSQIDYTCQNGHGVQVIINSCTNEPETINCTYPDTTETRLPKVTENQTWLYAERPDPESPDPENPEMIVITYPIFNAGPPPGGAICTPGPAIWIYSNKMYRCPDLHQRR